jgi:hypothetical protein
MPGSSGKVSVPEQDERVRFRSSSLVGQSLPKWVFRAMSAFPPIATEMRRPRDVSNVPQADSCTAAIESTLFDDLVGAREKWRWDVQSESLGCLEVDNQLKFCRRLHRKIGWLLATQDAINVANSALLAAANASLEIKACPATIAINATPAIIRILDGLLVERMIPATHVAGVSIPSARYRRKSPRCPAVRRAPVRSPAGHSSSGRIRREHPRRGNGDQFGARRVIAPPRESRR